MTNYRHNHYVPEWYQYRFIPSDAAEKKFYYLDLNPGTFVNENDPHKTKRFKKSIKRWGPPSCFQQEDLYTTKFGQWESTEIEQKFFGKIDKNGEKAIEYFTNFQHPSANGDVFRDMMNYLSTQKLRTPKGLANLSEIINDHDKNRILFRMQELQNFYCAIWTESIWLIADASRSDTKFIISDHPVTVYNYGFFPDSLLCKNHNDPDIILTGTHTIFPLSLEKVLILTNLSWIRNPYTNPAKQRPNPNPFRQAVFDFQTIQTGRILSETEVQEINFIIKKRAYKYIAAGKEEWLYPEKSIPTQHWSKLGKGHLLMPDPRSVIYSNELVIGYKGGRAEAFDEYGRKPGQDGYGQSKDFNTFQAYQGEFARIFGPKRRGMSNKLGDIDRIEDDEDFHQYHLSLEKIYKPKNIWKRS